MLIIPHPKEKKPKIVPLTDEDMDLIRDIPVGFPEIKFFRHLEGARQKHMGQPYHFSYLERAWKRACKKVGIEGVSLYPGTKHSTAMELRKVATYEEVRSMTGHATNKAFERYFRSEGNDLKALYARRKTLLPGEDQTEHGLNTKSGPFKKRN